MEETDLINPPLVSICIPAHNCEKHISECVRSVLNQTYKNIEVIIVDDGSTDKTPSILADLKNNHIRIFHQKKSGAAAARNLAYHKSKGPFIKFLDGDDIINPGMIESQVKLATTNNECIISAKWGRFYNNDINTFKFSPEECWQTLPACQWICSSWRNGHSMMQSGIFLLPRRIIEKAGYWDEGLTLIDDLDFFTRVILTSPFVIFDPNAILYYRSGNSGSLSDHKHHQAMQSAFSSMDKATKTLLAICTGPEAKMASANIWQHLIYTIYPQYPNLVRMAQEKINQLGGSSLPFVAGGLTKRTASLIGWKLTKRLKNLFRLP
jgi:glycosyltransferase involved in cell wall biosynthesis